MKRASELFDRLVANEEFERILFEYRKKAKIPEKAFKSKKEYGVWLKKQEGIPLTKDHPLIPVIEYTKKVFSAFPALPKSFKYVLDDLLFFDKTDQLESVHFLDILPVTTHNLSEVKEGLEPGLYIRINNGVSYKEVIEDLENQKYIFEVYQGLVSGRKKSNQPKRFRHKKNWRRDQMVFYFSKMSRENLQSMAPEENLQGRMTKDQMVAKVFNYLDKKFDVERKPLTDYAVHKIITSFRNSIKLRHL